MFTPSVVVIVAIAQFLQISRGQTSSLTGAAFQRETCDRSYICRPELFRPQGRHSVSGARGKRTSNRPWNILDVVRRRLVQRLDPVGVDVRGEAPGVARRAARVVGREVMQR